MKRVKILDKKKFYGGYRFNLLDEKFVYNERVFNLFEGIYMQLSYNINKYIGRSIENECRK